MLNAVTFTLTLPEGGTFEDQIEGLRAARNAQHKFSNPGAAQSLSIILALAERGKLAFETDTVPPPFGLETWQPIATKPQWTECEERGIYTDDGNGLFYFKATHWRPLVR